jgi:hypothetical protein
MSNNTASARVDETTRHRRQRGIGGVLTVNKKSNLLVSIEQIFFRRSTNKLDRLSLLSLHNLVYTWKVRQDTILSSRFVSFMTENIAVTYRIVRDCAPQMLDLAGKTCQVDKRASLFEKMFIRYPSC